MKSAMAAMSFRPKLGRFHSGLFPLHGHLMEMWRHPECALLTGDRVRKQSPGMDHPVDMPTHIAIQCGHYHDVMDWN